jgi:hypothetical protein
LGFSETPRRADDAEGLDVGPDPAVLLDERARLLQFEDHGAFSGFLLWGTSSSGACAGGVAAGFSGSGSPFGIRRALMAARRICASTFSSSLRSFGLPSLLRFLVVEIEGPPSLWLHRSRGVVHLELARGSVRPAPSPISCFVTVAR